MEQLNILRRFQLNKLETEWIDSVWDGNFLTFTDLSDEYLSYLEFENLENLLKETCTVIKNWIAENNSEFEVRWQTLNSLGINLRGLLAFLGYFMKVGQQISADEDSRQCCLRASSLYFMLLAIPGSSVYLVFHPNLYQRAIETFKLAHHLAPRQKKTTRSIEFEDLYINDEENVETLAHSEQVTLIKALNCIMFDLITMLKTFFMRDKPRSLQITVQSLIEISKLETSCNHFQTHNKPKDASLTSLSYNAYVALQELCSPNHGPVNLTIKLIAKCALPYLSSSCTELPQKSLVVVQETTIHFLKNLQESHESETESGILILIQHLMANCPDRLEFRQKQAAVVTKLINICKGDLFLKAIENLVLFSFHNKVACRIFAQEIISKCLIEFHNSDFDERLQAKKVLVSVTLGRCVDSSNLVRGRAMAIIASCTEVDNPNRVTIHDIFEAPDRNQPFPPTLDQLKQSIFEDIDPFPDSSLIRSMLMDRLEDERALVRRSALQIFRNIVSLFPEIVDEVAPQIGLRCRDPALTVRSFAIQVLTQLLHENPENTNLIDSWIRSVVPQIFDIEPKVQEKSLESLQSLILNEIKPASNTRQNDRRESLPWTILDRLTKEKMRKHLSKSCELWKKSEVLSRSLISKIESHIETQNNTPAWVLLAAFSETMQLPLMDRHFSDYESLLQGKDFCARLKLEVLRNSWPSMNRNFLQQLYTDLLKCLSKFDVNLALISISFDILAGVAKLLEEEMETNMRELMNLCEIQIEKIFADDREEAVEAGPIYVKAMCTLGHAAFLCTAKTSSSTVRTLQGLLLQWENIPELLQTRKEMQASAIVLLGQLAMRDRELAEETMPIFGKLMSQPADSDSTESANKVNSAKTLADLCVRFTALVESYLPDMCVSMKDPNPLVREVIVVIFIQLLLEDFVKVKGPFFFHILTMLTDSDETIRELTVFLIKERLLAKNKTLVSQQFLKSIFHYNDCQSINKFAVQTMREMEKNVLTLPGKANENKRRMIYDFMLEHLDPPGKLKLICRMTSEILAGVCNNSIDVKLEAEASILRDVLYILSSEHLQASLCKQTDDDSQEEMGNVPSTPSNHAINVIADGIKKHRLEVLLPIIVKLKIKLTKIKSPLLVEVSKFFVKIISDYNNNKEQLSSLYNEYPDLEKDIEAETRKYGKKAQNDEESEMEELPSPAENERPPINLKSVLTQSPKIVLRRLSTLMYSEGGKSASPPRTGAEFSRPLTPRTLNFSTPRQRPESPEPGPSCSTQKNR